MLFHSRRHDYPHHQSKELVLVWSSTLQVLTFFPFSPLTSILLCAICILEYCDAPLPFAPPDLLSISLSPALGPWRLTCRVDVNGLLALWFLMGLGPRESLSGDPEGGIARCSAEAGVGCIPRAPVRWPSLGTLNQFSPFGPRARQVTWLFLL